jgi:hypothetical protein
LELLVGLLAAISVAAIVVRLLLRASDANRLPPVVDRSIGMYLLRRASGRPTWPPDAEGEPGAEAVGRRGLIPVRPTRLVVSAPLARAVPPTRLVPQPPDHPGIQAHRRGLLGRWQGVVALVVIGLVGLAAISVGPRLPQEGVLSITGTPPGSPALAAEPSTSPTPTGVASGPVVPESASPSIEPPSPSTGPTAAVPSATVKATARPTPRRTPRPTRTPTVATPTPSASPSAAPSDTPSASPSDTPSASPSDSPSPSPASPSVEPPP